LRALRAVAGSICAFKVTSMIAQPQPHSALFSRSSDIANTSEEAWTRTCRRLRTELGEAVYNSWFARLELVRIDSGVAHLSVPTKFLKSWIQAHYMDRIRTILSGEFGAIERLSVEVRSSSKFRSPLRETDAERRPVLGAGAAPLASPTSHAGSASDADEPRREAAFTHADANGLSGSPLDKRFTFASFLVGSSNQLAHAAAMRTARTKPGDPILFNPLYIHASVGLGKTHLLQATAHEAGASARRVIYLTAEKFMYGFVAALKAQTAIAFKEKLRGIDVLVIDDVQFLQGKSIQQEFCHTLNALIDAGRQIVIAADRPPGELESLDERVRSRLAGGLCVDMGSLDEALRVQIIEARIAATREMQPQFSVPPAVIAYVASAIQTNGRDLEGAVNRLLAHSTLTGTPLSVETAETAIRDLIRTREPKRVKIEDIQKLVASHYNVSRADILSSRRTANVVRPRQIAMYLSKLLTLRSLPEIGRRFGGRDHTTVLHAVRKIEELSGRDGMLLDEIELLKRMLLE
jgi:chromosomal replication initiator protein